MTVGRVAVQLAGGTALTSCVGLYSDTREIHTVFRLLKYSWLPRSWEGRRELAIMVSRLCGKVCAPSAQGPWPQRSAWISSTEVRNAVDNGFSLLLAYEIGLEVHEIFVETAEVLNVWAGILMPSSAVRMALLSLSADGCSLRIFEEVSAFAQENGWSSLGLGGAVGLHPS
ncbi:hypothetical protein EVAR_41895_1 [Eumeta japonica]|uniref:Uncharacterized protein n=1 Tax=Eumeta variegata TaxID=151549 RepID=A0A4C1YMI2_EUMVA|nr:hypothetical protein EVAR_41895_1 [Eumeta japonica]